MKNGDIFSVAALLSFIILCVDLAFAVSAKYAGPKLGAVPTAYGTVNRYTHWFFPPSGSKARYFDIRLQNGGGYLNRTVHERPDESKFKVNACYFKLGGTGPIETPGKQPHFENFEIRGDEFGSWVVVPSLYWRNPSTGVWEKMEVRISEETFVFGNGKPLDITVPGGPLHFALWNVPAQAYSIVSKGSYYNVARGFKIYDFEARHSWSPPEDKYNPYFKETRKSLKWSEKWRCFDSRYCQEPGKWAVDRTEWMARDVGRMWAYRDVAYGIGAYMAKRGTFSAGSCQDAKYSFR